MEFIPNAGGSLATRNVIDAAVARGADALIVHHGYFWKGEDPRITGMKRERLARLLKADINLIGYHLPLDVHPDLGNNVQLGLQLGVTGTPAVFTSEGELIGGYLKPDQMLKALQP